MKKNLSIYSDVSIVALVFETIFLTTIFFIITYITNKTDPLMIKEEINILLIFISVITLFYGLIAGIILIFISGIFIHSFYSPFPLNYFVNNILFMLIFAEFHYFWQRKIKRYQKELDYLNSRFVEINTAFQMLKLSHDQMEKSYITKVKSIRNIIAEIKKLYLIKPENAYEELFNVIVKNYGIRKGFLLLYDKNTFKKIISLNSQTEPDFSSLVLTETISRKKPTYLPEYKDFRKDYLAAIPGNTSSDNLLLILVIEDISFINYTKETIFSIWVILNYFSDVIKSFEENSELIKKYPTCPEEFIIEIKRMSYMKKQIGTNSTILLIKNQSEISTTNVAKFIELKIRSSDIICSKANFIFILFPLSSYENIISVIEKLKNDIKSNFALKDESISFMVFDVLEMGEKTIDYLYKFILENDTKSNNIHFNIT
ncbi:MAG: hypothetical protein N2Z20_03295 [Elusimicrobiales bacterium]|nr:hypothetical protein [Elusimicrobiales bacterium]